MTARRERQRERRRGEREHRRGREREERDERDGAGEREFDGYGFRPPRILCRASLQICGETKEEAAIPVIGKK